MNEHRLQRMERRRRSRRAVAVVLLALATTALGCASKEINTDYGVGRTSSKGKSINGTGVLQTMFERAGHKVITRSRLTPRLQSSAECIVWCPDDFAPPNAKTRDWFEQWLCDDEGYDRKLIYVGRDYDAETAYWQKIQPGAPAKQAPIIQAKLNDAKTRIRGERAAAPVSRDAQWFGINGREKPRKVTTLEGEWAEGIDATKAEIELNGRFEPSAMAEILLESEGDAIVSREVYGDRGGQLIVVTNGSFLLNLPLVNHEHRKLAGKLINAIGGDSQYVVFVESTAGGPGILDEDPTPRPPTGMEIFAYFPANWILLQLALVGIIYCFVRLPIFGRPRTREAEATSDFKKHIEAMGEMLERSGNRGYAKRRISVCKQMLKSD